ncbi:MAG: DNA polymerase ligase N-terminal domain-containing protein [Candidatus Bathyarchaeota archaeon]
MSDPLKDYRDKRDFNQTPEPVGETHASTKKSVFVIQKHDARNLHYDLRLEHGGVLKSWAVPKGPSMDPMVKRLAVPTEDHPMGYLDFEGVIPKGNYGAGTLIVWDIGLYRNLKGDDADLGRNLDEGHATIWLEGAKLRGGFALIRTKRGGKRPQWLFFKMKDEQALPGSEILTERPNSVKTGRSLKEVEEQEEPADIEGFQ